MSSTFDAGTDEWRALAGPRRGRGRPRSQASLAFEATLRGMLAKIDAPDLSGLWLDFVDARVEPVWLSTPAGEARDAAATADRWST